MTWHSIIYYIIVLQKSIFILAQPRWPIHQKALGTCEPGVRTPVRATHITAPLHSVSELWVRRGNVRIRAGGAACLRGGKTSARARARGMMRDRRLSLTEATRQIGRSYPRFPKRVGGKGRTQDLFWARWFHYLRSLDLLPLERLDASREA